MGQGSCMICDQSRDGQVLEAAVWDGVGGVGRVLHSGSSGQLVEAADGGEWGAAASGREARCPAGERLDR